MSISSLTCFISALWSQVFDDTLELSLTALHFLCSFVRKSRGLHPRSTHTFPCGALASVCTPAASLPPGGPLAGSASLAHPFASPPSVCCAHSIVGPPRLLSLLWPRAGCPPPGTSDFYVACLLSQLLGSLLKCHLLNKARQAVLRWLGP